MKLYKSYPYHQIEIDIYILFVVVNAILSWTKLPPSHPAVKFFKTPVEPVLKPMRKAFPPKGGFDFTPFILLIALQILRRI